MQVSGVINYVTFTEAQTIKERQNPRRPAAKIELLCQKRHTDVKSVLQCPTMHVQNKIQNGIFFFFLQ